MNTQESIKPLVYKLIQELGENPDRVGLIETPARVAKSLREITNGYGKTPGDVVGDGLFASDSTAIVVQKNTEFYSVCEHHLLPFFGEIHLTYIPNGKIIGLSKIGRLIDVFAHRLQVQERLTQELADAFYQVLSPTALAIRIEAQHFCMMMRGVRKQKGNTVTFTVKGEAEHNLELRKELLSYLS